MLFYAYTAENYTFKEEMLRFTEYNILNEKRKSKHDKYSLPGTFA